MQEVVETVLTPPHPNPFETLLDEPLTGTLDHPTAQWQAQFLVPGIVDVITVPLQIRIHRCQSVPRRVGQALYVQGFGQVGQDPIGIAMPQAVPCPGEPPLGLRGTAIEPGGRTLPQVLRRVVKVQDACSIARELLLKQAPQPSSAITEPDDLRRAPMP